MDQKFIALTTSRNKLKHDSIKQINQFSNGHENFSNEHLHPFHWNAPEYEFPYFPCDLGLIQYITGEILLWIQSGQATFEVI